MNAKETALDLVNKFSDYSNTFSFCTKGNRYGAIKNALIAVQLILNANPHSNPFNSSFHSTILFWSEVKQELEKL